jgi:3-oxoacyl-[acyl-carrier protein] reductase
MTLSGRKALITGANQGLGLETARHCVAQGADVMLCARNQTLLDEAVALLQSQAKPQQIVRGHTADISKPEDVETLVSQTLAQLGGCDILVNNAGVYGPKGDIADLDWAEWVKAIEINLLGSVLMARAWVPYFKAQGHGKIIQLSGGGATNPLPGISAYAVSKAAIVRFAETLAEELRAFNIDVNSVAPGALNTRMLDEVLAAGPDKVGQAFYERSQQQKTNGGVPLSLAASLIVFLASRASDGITGKLISAQWDRWQDWPDHLEALNRSDVYTLRRITGRDRGFDWGDV